jgi:hypothetical protein
MRSLSLACCLALLLASPASADRLQLSDGTILEGVYAGGEAGLVLFQVDQGELRSVPVSELRSLLFEEPAEPSLRVPSLTVLTMRLTQPIGHGHHEGSYFKGVLEEPLLIDGTTVAAEGTPTLGRISRAKGARSQATLRLTDLIIGGRRHRVTTEPVPLDGTLAVQSLVEFRLTSKFHVRESDLGK